jgi:sugar phosphate isomerase/epimerase
LSWASLARALDEIGYEGPIMLECIRELRKRPETIDEAFLSLLDSIRGIR